MYQYAQGSGALPASAHRICTPPPAPPPLLQATMAYTYTLFYSKNSDFDEVEAYRRIRAELRHPFEIRVRYHRLR